MELRQSWPTHNAWYRSVVERTDPAMRSSASGGARLTSSSSSHQPSRTASTSAPSTYANAKPPSDASAVRSAADSFIAKCRHSALSPPPPMLVLVSAGGNATPLAAQGSVTSLPTGSSAARKCEQANKP
jgi:hypothetical protein